MGGALNHNMLCQSNPKPTFTIDNRSATISNQKKQTIVINNRQPINPKPSTLNPKLLSLQHTATHETLIRTGGAFNHNMLCQSNPKPTFTIQNRSATISNQKKQTIVINNRQQPQPYASQTFNYHLQSAT